MPYDPLPWIDKHPMPTAKKDLSQLTLLGRKARPSKKLEVFPNHHPERRYTVTLCTNEFTCLCPATGQPDFASITIKYIPDRWILESKSLKLYLWSYRQEGVFHEHVVNTICDDVVKVLDPYWIEVTGVFGSRGGIAISVVATHVRKPRRKARR
jgi:7-cyano-7-deazaguanine reductase